MTYSNLIKKLVFTEGFSPPDELEHGGLRATPINRSDLVDDVRGINSSLDLIGRTRGGGWPTGPVTEEENYVDLVWHECEHRDRTSFTYVIRDAGGGYLGCLYLYPLGRRAALTDQLMEHDVDVSWWVTERAYEEGWYVRVYQALQDWVVQQFPFSNPHYSNAEIPM